MGQALSDDACFLYNQRDELGGELFFPPPVVFAALFVFLLVLGLIFFNKETNEIKERGFINSSFALATFCAPSSC
jgi:hypothetical protein